MRIGLAARESAATVDEVLEEVQQAEGDGFSSFWFASPVLGDPMAAIGVIGRETSTIELGTSILQTYSCHPVLQSKRASSVVNAIGTPGRFTLGLGPSHRLSVEDWLGLSYARPGQHTEEYMQVITALLRGERVDFDGSEYRVHVDPPVLPGGQEIPVLLAALGPRLLRVAGQYTAGTILFLANAQAVEDHVAPLLRKAAAAANKPGPRIVVGLPVAVHDDVDEARAAAAVQLAHYQRQPNYQRLLALGGVEQVADVVIVGNEESVAAQIERLFRAGATDYRARILPVGPDPKASAARTRALLAELAAA